MEEAQYRWKILKIPNKYCDINRRAKIYRKRFSKAKKPAVPNLIHFSFVLARNFLMWT